MFVAGLAIGTATLVLAQIIDGRVAVFLGVGALVGLDTWRTGRRFPVEYVGVALGTLAGLAVFFALIQVDLFRSSAFLAWVALLLGVATVITVEAMWRARLHRSMRGLIREALLAEEAETTAAAEHLLRGDRESAIAAVAAVQQKQREALGDAGIDVASIVPQVGKLIRWDQVLRHVFRVIEFDRSDTVIGADGRAHAASKTRPYGYLRVESPILNQPIRIPVLHRDDFWLAWSVYSEPKFVDAIKEQSAELLVTYAPKRVLPGGLNGTISHCLHYVLCPHGTLERYYPNSPVGDQRMAQPTPEVLFGAFVYDGEIRVGTNAAPVL